MFSNCYSYIIKKITCLIVTTNMVVFMMVGQKLV